MFENKPESYEEFWPYSVSQHLNPTCRKLHFVGTGLALSHLAIAPVFPPALLAAPVYGYGLAWIGHFVFEKNKPASWLGPRELVWSLRGDLRMFGKMIRGTMDAEIDRVRELLDDAERARAVERAEHETPTVTA